MIIVFGERRYGVVGKELGTAVATRWFHVWGVPLIPLRAVLELADGSALSVPWSPRSLALTAMRAWPFWAAPAVAFVWAQTPVLVGAGALYAATLAASFRVAATPRDERAKRLTFAEVTRLPVDVALLAEIDVATRRALERTLQSMAATVTADGYRATPSTWQDAVRGGAVSDRDFLVLALTLARFERGGAPAEARSTWLELERAAWTRLVALDPGVLTRVDAPSPALPVRNRLLDDDALAAPPPPPTPVAPPPAAATIAATTRYNSRQHRVVGAVMTVVGAIAVWTAPSHAQLHERWGYGVFGATLGSVAVFLAVVGEPRDERGAVVAWHKRGIAIAASVGFALGVAYCVLVL